MSQSPVEPDPATAASARPSEAWLAKAAPEPILEPELPIIDTHHHLWERPDHRYLLHELLADLGTGHNVVATVFLECHAMYRADGPAEMRPVGETEFVAGIAAMSDSGDYGATRVAAGIVGFADLALGDRVEPVLQAQLRAGGGRFRGVRHSAAWDASDDHRQQRRGHAARTTCGAPSSGRGWPGSPRSACRWMPGCSIPSSPTPSIWPARSPAANIIMGHCGGPLGYGPYAGKRDEVFAAWKAGITELATCPNVTMKLGGMMMRLAAYDYGAAAGAAVLGRAGRRSGGRTSSTASSGSAPSRCIFESNFPVEKMGIGYAALWNAFKRITAGASADEKRALFSGTARRVYRLD